MSDDTKLNFNLTEAIKALETKTGFIQTSEGLVYTNEKGDEFVIPTYPNTVTLKNSFNTEEITLITN